MKTIKTIIIGAGQRGLIFADYAKRFPNELQVVGVAEPREDRLKEMGDAHNVPMENRTSDWKELLSREKFADCVMVATQDRMHVEPSMMALDRGYDVLCEKPISHISRELLDLEKKAEETGRILIVAHSLRYSVFYSKIKELIDNGVIGDLVGIQQIESIGYWHMAHSFVRGNWRSSEETSPIILAKCCHDVDILGWLVGSPLSYLSSYGSLKHFKSENRPDGAPDRCMDGCSHRDKCPYYAPRFYLEHDRAKSDGFAKVVSIDTSEEGILDALRTGPYGRCVYACDNDVPDNQILNMIYKNGVTVSMTMNAFTNKCERIVNIMGTHGQIKGNMDEGVLEISDFVTGHSTTIKLHSPVGSHSGSDVIMLKSFVEAINNKGKELNSSVKNSIEGHLACIAAEESRIENGKNIDFVKWCDSL